MSEVLVVAIELPLASEPFDEPLSERELDALDQDWKPLTLLVGANIGGAFAMNSLARYLEWRDRINARRGCGYPDDDPWADV
jgi:hypothetical protein